jgi:hypothetical protein
MKDGDDAPCMSGTLVKGLFEVAREALGDEIVERGLSLTPEAARSMVVDALPGSWVPIETVELVFGAVARAAGRELPELHVELARMSVGRALKTFWRLLLRFTTDEALVSRTPVIFGKAYNRGRLIPSIPVPGRSEIVLADWPDVPDWPIRGTRAGIEAVLRAAGRKDVRVEGRRTATGATYVATWKKD